MWPMGLLFFLRANSSETAQHNVDRKDKLSKCAERNFYTTKEFRENLIVESAREARRLLGVVIMCIRFLANHRTSL